LKQGLGPWIQQNKNRVHEAYTTERSNLLWVNEQTKFHGHPLVSIQRNSILFTAISTTIAMELPPNAIPVDIIKRDPNTIKTSRTAQQCQSKDPLPKDGIKKHQSTGNISSARCQS
jgi:hypothetical protein